MAVGTKAPPIQRLEHWTLVTNDLERSKRFYVEIMGAIEPERGAGPTSVDLAGTLIDLFPASEGRAPMPGTTGQHHAYIIKLEDYDLWVEHFKANGIEYRRATHAMERISVYVDDPDGYHLELTVPLESEEAGRREMEKRGLLGTAMNQGRPARA
jgi:catechol 2,3-dioxygenase-like lactoylglutathione lyase family enzyme